MLKIIRWRFYNSVWKYFIFHISIWRIFFWHRRHIAHIRIFLVQPLHNIVCFKNRHPRLNVATNFHKIKIRLCQSENNGLQGSLWFFERMQEICEERKRYIIDNWPLSEVDLDLSVLHGSGLNFLVFIMWSRTEHGLHNFLQWNAAHK